MGPEMRGDPKIGHSLTEVTRLGNGNVRVAVRRWNGAFYEYQWVILPKDKVPEVVKGIRAVCPSCDGPKAAGIGIPPEAMEAPGASSTPALRRVRGGRDGLQTVPGSTVIHKTRRR